MATIRKNHNKQVKFKAAMALYKSEKTIAEVSQEYGVHQSVLHRWKKILMEEGPDIFDDGREKKQVVDPTIGDLERKIGQLTMELDFLKKSLGAINKKDREKLIIMEHALSVREQCKLLDINRSNLYYCPKEAFDDTQLMNRISEINCKFPCYGYRKMHWYLTTKDGHNINRKKVQRLMKLMGLKAIFPGPKTSVASSEGSVFPYLLNGLDIVRANQVWSVDITYIKLPVGMVYLFALIDWHSRGSLYPINWSILWKPLHGIEVIEMALIHGTPEICNSDQGSQFTGHLWIQKLQEHEIKISHDGVGRCIDNVRIERFWRTIKYEDIFIQSYNTITEAKLGIKKFIEHYNYQRPHPVIGL